ncbi:hypothetical protein ABKN59_001383 [Abortiporus biennis]
MLGHISLTDLFRRKPDPVGLTTLKVPAINLDKTSDFGMHKTILIFFTLYVAAALQLTGMNLARMVKAFIYQLDELRLFNLSTTIIILFINMNPALPSAPNLFC